MKTIDWNQASKLGLIVRINKEILHPLGLAITRNEETGASDHLIVADDGVFNYPKGIVLKPINKEDVRLEVEPDLHSFCTLEKAYIETKYGQCVARFCNVSMEIYDTDGKILFFKNIPTMYKPNDKDWDCFKEQVLDILDYELPDEVKPDIFEWLVSK